MGGRGVVGEFGRFASNAVWAMAGCRGASRRVPMMER